jgi:hypothetical protein
MQKLEGDGWVFVQMGGTIVERDAAQAGEELHVDTGCLAAYTPGIDFDIHRPWAASSSACCSAAKACSSRGCAVPARSGSSRCPSRAWPAVCSAAGGSTGGQNRGEGSVLGGLGNLLDGDNSM